MKRFVRDHNTSFNLNDVRLLAAQWMAALDSSTSTSFLEHAHQNEDVYKEADSFVEEEIEPELDEESDFDSEVSSNSQDGYDSP
jgi:hypothetical protein